jgi:hypothetical protein
MSPPDRDASLAALRAAAPGAFGILLERGYATSDAPDGVDFTAADRRLRVGYAAVEIPATSPSAWRAPPPRSSDAWGVRCARAG